MNNFDNDNVETICMTILLLAIFFKCLCDYTLNRNFN